jgi:2-polyprenyl-3-methyl-5-hydroxy-6-metoxy-1,4-benzoquinol methylase
MTGQTRPDAVHEHYGHYSPDMARRLDGFYGRVEQSMAERLARWIVGQQVLDIGCGFGALVDALRRRGFEVVGIDMLEDCIETGRQRYPQADLRVVTSGPLPFPDKSFDTVVLKDAIHHILAEADLAQFLQEVRRVCRGHIIVIDPNPTLILHVARWLVGHVDPVCSSDTAARALTAAGFDLIHREFHEVVAFPLSGGYVGLPLVPRGAIGSVTLAVDRLALHMLRGLGLDGRFCWRYLLVASVR